MAGQMTAEQQAIVALRDELAQTCQQVAQAATAHEALRSAHDALNVAAQNAFREKDRRISEVETILRNMIFKQQFDLLDAKELKPDVFK